MDKITPEYKAISERIECIIKESRLQEMQKYALLAGCITKVAHKYNRSDFAMIKAKLAIVCKTMLDAVGKAEQIFGKLKNK